MPRKILNLRISRTNREKKYLTISVYSPKYTLNYFFYFNNHSDRTRNNRLLYSKFNVGLCKREII